MGRLNPEYLHKFSKNNNLLYGIKDIIKTGGKNKSNLKIIHEDFNFSIKIKTTRNKRKGITPLEFFRIQAALKKWPDSSSSSKDSYYKKVIRDFIFIQSSFLLSFSNDSLPKGLTLFIFI